MQLYDGVTIPPDGKFPSMTGVIVYKKDDTIGVRLTGDSEGMGDHSGTVDGVHYFDGGVESGVLTTVQQVEPRKLTFSEESLVRSWLQPNPAHSSFSSAPMASGVPLSGLSPAALARMMQLNQRMGVTAPTATSATSANGSTSTTSTGTSPTHTSASASASTPRNKLPPTTPPPAATPPTTPHLQDPPSVESPPAEEKPAEKKLSRLEILRQKKEAIRKRKLELERKVEETKKEKLQQQQQEEEGGQVEDATSMPLEPTARDSNKTTSSSSSSSPPKSTSSSSPKTSSSSPPAPSRVIRNASESSIPDAASVKSKEHESSSMLSSKASRSSRDSIEDLWIRELRHEAPAAADRYELEDAEHLLLQEDEEERPLESNHRSIVQIRGMPPPPSAAAESSNRSNSTEKCQANDKQVGDDSKGRKVPMRQSSMTRLQQLRQKKRLLEALPASIQTPKEPPPLLPIAKSTSTSLANMAIQSATIAASFLMATQSDDDDDDEMETDSKGSAMEVGTDDEDMDAFQESVTITSGNNLLPSGIAVAVAAAAAGSVEEAETFNNLKRRRMLGLGFLPGINRQQKRQNTGRDRQEQ